VYFPKGFGREGLEVSDGDCVVEKGKVIHKSLVKRKLKVKGGTYDNQRVWYTNAGYTCCYRQVRQAVQKVWKGKGNTLEVELEEAVQEQLIRCLLVHLAKRRFWDKKVDRHGKLINHTALLVMVVRNYLIDIARSLQRRGISMITNSILMSVLETRDANVLIAGEAQSV
jgi:hypothetical protein